MTKVNSQAIIKPNENDPTETEYEMKKSDYIALFSATKTAKEKIIKLKKEKLALKENMKNYQKAFEKVKDEKQQLADKLTSELEVANAQKRRLKVNNSELHEIYKWNEEELDRKAMEEFKSDVKMQKEQEELKKYLGV
jgi:hypothetical protein